MYTSFWAGDVAQQRKRLPGKHQVVGSILGLKKKRDGGRRGRRQGKGDKKGAKGVMHMHTRDGNIRYYQYIQIMKANRQKVSLKPDYNNTYCNVWI